MEEYAGKIIYKKVHEIYEQAEKLKLLAWEMLEQEQDLLVWTGHLTPEEKYSDAEAVYDGKILKITVRDLLPRKTEVKSSAKTPSRLLRDYWIGNIVNAVKKLNEKVNFEKALCVIRIISPSNREWDVDNRAVSFILNALRISQVIPGDSWKATSLLLLGDKDPDPKTEIFVLEYPEDAINDILTG